MNASKPLTRFEVAAARDEAVLTFIRDFIRGHHYGPTGAEIVQAIDGVTNEAHARQHLARLEKAGKLTLTGGWRGIELPAGATS